MKKYCLYQITNNINGKVYVGAHATTNVNDSYRGSGTAILDAYKKYGAENFSKDILVEFDNATDMYAEEAEIVNEEFVANRNTYNIKLGGKGGKGSTKSEAHKQALSESVKAGYAAGRISRIGGRSPTTPNILELVGEHGIRGTAKVLNITYEAARCRYYRMKCK